MNYLIFSFGVFIGTCVGVIIAALLSAASNRKNDVEQLEQLKRELKFGPRQ